MNRKVNKNSGTGIKGVELLKNGKYRAVITLNKKDISLGSYINSDDAKNARLEAEIKYFGEYRNKDQ